MVSSRPRDRPAGGDAADGPALVAQAEILPAGTSPRVDERWAIQAGACSGISIGFLPKSIDKPQRPGQTGRTYTSVELLEISSVTVPSCPTCVITGKRARASFVRSSGVANVDPRRIAERVVRDMQISRAVREGVGAAFRRAR